MKTEEKLAMKIAEEVILREQANKGVTPLNYTARDYYMREGAMQGAAMLIRLLKEKDVELSWKDLQE